MVGKVFLVGKKKVHIVKPRHPLFHLEYKKAPFVNICKLIVSKLPVYIYKHIYISINLSTDSVYVEILNAKCRILIYFRKCITILKTIYMMRWVLLLLLFFFVNHKDSYTFYFCNKIFEFIFTRPHLVPENVENYFILFINCS